MRLWTQDSLGGNLSHSRTGIKGRAYKGYKLKWTTPPENSAQGSQALSLWWMRVETSPICWGGLDSTAQRLSQVGSHLPLPLPHLPLSHVTVPIFFSPSIFFRDLLMPKAGGGSPSHALVDCNLRGLFHPMSLDEISFTFLSPRSNLSCGLCLFTSHHTAP